jgi:nicotinamidase-related amidase
MPIIWVFKSDDPPFKPTRLNGRHLLDLFSRNSAPYIIPSIHPHATDYVTLKNKTNAFSNPMLRPFLRTLGIQNAYFAGFRAGQCIYDSACGGLVDDPLTIEYRLNTHIILPLTADTDNQLTHIYEDDLEKQGVSVLYDLETIFGKRYPAPVQPSYMKESIR